MKIVLMGCNHAGTWAAKTLLRKKKPEDEVLIFDRNDNIFVFRLRNRPVSFGPSWKPEDAFLFVAWRAWKNGRQSFHAPRD